MVILRKTFIIFILWLVSFSAIGQAVQFEFMQKENELKERFSQLYISENDKTSDSLNNIIIDIFSAILKNPESFDYNWNSLNMIGQVHSKDKKLNVYTWYVKNVKGIHTYYGFIQYNIGKKNKPDIRLYILTDKSKGMKNAETLSLSAGNWLGCVYYNIHAFSYKRHKYYTLLGYNFNNDFSDKKYIEVLVFDKEGVPAFEGDFQLEFQKVKRVIFEYSAQLVASINYNEKLQMIVCDHLSPFETMFSGNYRFYGPDGSYDGFKFRKGTFFLQKDVDARNIQ